LGEKIIKKKGMLCTQVHLKRFSVLLLFAINLNENYGQAGVLLALRANKRRCRRPVLWTKVRVLLSPAALLICFISQGIRRRCENGFFALIRPEIQVTDSYSSATNGIYLLLLEEDSAKDMWEIL
jgi:hypothetical protein